MTLQPLFPEPILEQRPLDPGYDDHASDVWLVRTASEEAVVRASRLTDRPDNDFWWGVRNLFGIDPRRVFDLEAVNGYLSELSSVPVPRVLRKGTVNGRPHVVVERMQGTALPRFEPRLMRELGEALARIHSRRFGWCGAPAGTLRYAPEEFHPRLAATMQGLVERFYPEHGPIQSALPAMCEGARKLPAPDAGALVMVDMDPTQFLTDGEQITALVDTEAYVLAPRELDFIGLEYVLDAEGAAELAAGYRQVLPLPDLTAVRPVYRYYYRLIRVQGSVELDRWMGWPELF